MLSQDFLEEEEECLCRHSSRKEKNLLLAQAFVGDSGALGLGRKPTKGFLEFLGITSSPQKGFREVLGITNGPKKGLLGIARNC